MPFFICSGARLTTLAALLQSSLPLYPKLELGYVAVWTALCAIATVLSFVGFNAGAVR